MDILVLLVIAYLAFQAGSMYTTYKLRELIIRDALAKGIDITAIENKIEKKKTNTLIIEYDNNVMYLYDNETNTFVCQGQTVEELANLAKKYKNIEHAIVLDSKSNQVFTFADGKVL